MNRINPAKLLMSKWTAVRPQNMEQHFLVSKLLHDEEDRVVSVVIEAVISRNTYILDWRELKDSSRWLMGWR
jgi:tryptophan-rich hypothetical protein